MTDTSLQDADQHLREVLFGDDEPPQTLTTQCPRIARIGPHCAPDACTMRVNKAWLQNAGAKRASPSRVLTFRPRSPPPQTSEKVRRLSKNLVGLVAWHFVPTRLFFCWWPCVGAVGSVVVLVHFYARSPPPCCGGGSKKHLFTRTPHQCGNAWGIEAFVCVRPRPAFTTFYYRVSYFTFFDHFFIRWRWSLLLRELSSALPSNGTRAIVGR